MSPGVSRCCVTSDTAVTSPGLHQLPSGKGCSSQVIISPMSLLVQALTPLVTTHLHDLIAPKGLTSEFHHTGDFGLTM